MKVSPYWCEDVPPRPVREQPLLEDCDIVVVGAGYAGLHAALELARNGRSVQVFDKEQAGFGCSSRNGGITSGTTKFRLTDLTETLGRDAAKALFQEGIDAEDWVEHFIAEEKIACGYHRSGRFVGAYRPAHYEDLAREAELVNREFDLGAHMLSRGEQHRELGTEHYHGGLVRDDVAAVQPALYVAGLYERAVSAGVTVHEACGVKGVRRDGDGFETETSRGRVRSRHVVVATNGYTDEGLPWLRRRLVPVASQIIATEPLDPDLMERLMPRKRMIVETRQMFHYYRPSPDHRRIVFGGRAGAWSERAEVKAEALRRNLVTIFPELEGTGLSHVWWGYVAFPFDKRPKLAEVDGIHYATGFCGSGVVWASWFGHLAARRIIAEAPVTTQLGNDPFQSKPLYNGWPWFLPFIVSWYRFRDWI